MARWFARLARRLARHRSALLVAPDSDVARRIAAASATTSLPAATTVVADGGAAGGSIASTTATTTTVASTTTVVATSTTTTSTAIATAPLLLEQAYKVYVKREQLTPLQQRLADHASDALRRGVNYGVLPWHRWNVDQVGIVLDIDASRTLDEKGAKSVFVRGRHGQHKESRTATFQIAVNLDGDATLQPRLMIVFRGTGTRIKRVEREAWDARVIVEFQRKAYMDNDMCMRWLRNEFAKAKKAADTLIGTECEHVLQVDGLSGQCTTEFIREAREMGVIVHVLPGGCTDAVQAVDQGIGKMLKHLFTQHLDQWLELPGNLEKWSSAPADGGLTTSEQRVLITHAAANAWEALLKTDVIAKCSRRAGSLIGVGGAGFGDFSLPAGCSTVDFVKDVGDDFNDNSDIDDNDDSLLTKTKEKRSAKTKKSTAATATTVTSATTDVVSSATTITRTTDAKSKRKRVNNNDDDDDDGDDDDDDDDVDEGDDDASSDDECISEMSEDDDDADAGDDSAKNAVVLIAPVDMQLVDLARDTVLKLDGSLVGAKIIIRNGARVDATIASVVRQATARDKATNVQINYAIRYDDDTFVLPVCLKNRDYGVDWQLVVPRQLGTGATVVTALSTAAPSTARDAPQVRDVEGDDERRVPRVPAAVRISARSMSKKK